jgi:PilZ domain
MLKLNPQQFAGILAGLQAAAETGGSEKRGFPRFDVQTRLTLAPMADGMVGRCYTALSRDVSANGLGFFQHTGYQPKESFLALFPGGKENFLIKCTATFCRPLAEGLFCVGAQFEAIADKALIEQFAKAHKASPPMDKAA